MASCKTCQFFVAPGPTAMEVWAADTRPQASGLSGLLAWLWRPQQFRPSPPGEFDGMLDGIGSCRRHPKRLPKRPTEWCGEYQEFSA